MTPEDVYGGAERDIDKFVSLRALQARDRGAFYTLLHQYTEEVLPYVYTPTVGEACQKYHSLGIKTQGLYLTLADKGRVLEKLRAFRPHGKTKVVVATDGERILGLGDLGAGGMGISEGKILLYTAASGVDPDVCLPVCLDVGTNNESLLQDPGYCGLRQRRATGDVYDDFIEEFVLALKRWQPHILLQFEDFGNHNAFRLLRKYQGWVCSFNDDIQGTAAITLAGILAALRLKKEALGDQRVVFLGAGEAGIGCGDLIAMAMSKQGELSVEEARRKILFLDSKGLVCASRGNLQHHKLAYAHDIPYRPDLLSVVREFKPTVLIGVSTIAGAFDKEVLEAMAAQCDRPIVFPLSNPTSKAECTFEQAMASTEGRVIFASGSPFAPLESPSVPGGTSYPAQANNAYIFPAVGHASLLCSCERITDEVFLEAAKKLAEISPDKDLEKGRLFPAFSKIRDVSATVMCHLAQYMCENGIGSRPEGCSDWLYHTLQQMYNPPKL